MLREWHRRQQSRWPTVLIPEASFARGRFGNSGHRRPGGRVVGAIAEAPRLQKPASASLQLGPHRGPELVDVDVSGFRVVQDWINCAWPKSRNNGSLLRPGALRQFRSPATGRPGGGRHCRSTETPKASASASLQLGAHGGPELVHVDQHPEVVRVPEQRVRVVAVGGRVL